MSLCTLNADTVYATRANIIVPALDTRTAAAVATAAVARLRDTVPLCTAATFTTPVKES